MDSRKLLKNPKEGVNWCEDKSNIFDDLRKTEEILIERFGLTKQTKTIINQLHRSRDRISA